MNYPLQIDNVIVDKSKAFALKVIALYKKLCDTNREFVMSKQLLKSGTSIGANIKEAQQGQSKADFYAKLYISRSKRQAKRNIGWSFYTKADISVKKSFLQSTKTAKKLSKSSSL